MSSESTTEVNQPAAWKYFSKHSRKARKDSLNALWEKYIVSRRHDATKCEIEEWEYVRPPTPRSEESVMENDEKGEGENDGNEEGENDGNEEKEENKHKGEECPEAILSTCKTPPPPNHHVYGMSSEQRKEFRHDLSSNRENPTAVRRLTSPRGTLAHFRQWRMNKRVEKRNQSKKIAEAKPSGKIGCATQLCRAFKIAKTKTLATLPVNKPRVKTIWRSLRGVRTVKWVGMRKDSLFLSVSSLGHLSSECLLSASPTLPRFSRAIRHTRSGARSSSSSLEVQGSSTTSLESRLQTMTLRDFQRRAPRARRHLYSLGDELEHTEAIISNADRGEGSAYSRRDHRRDWIGGFGDMINAARGQSYSETERMVRERLCGIDRDAAIRAKKD